MTRTVVIGLGNPVHSDDAVGVAIARAVRRSLGSRPDVEVVEMYVGGMAVMEACVGYERAVIVDAMTAGQRPGTIYRTTVGDLAEARTCACAHDTSLATALDIGRFLDIPLPPLVRVWGVEPADTGTFGEALTSEVSRAVPRVVAEILASLELDGGDGALS